MNADIQLSDTHPHGTPAGYLQGCHGSHCPAVMACRDVHRRYVGDFSFKRRFDAGVTLVQIMAQDAEEAAQERLKARQDTRVKRARKRRSQGNTANLKPAERLIPETVLRQNLADGLTDQQKRDQPPVCRVAGCTEPTTARDFCRSHYSRWSRSGDPIPPVRSADQSLTEEIWRPITGFEGLYDVSSAGRVRRSGAGAGAVPGRVLKPYPSGPNKYQTVSLSRDDHRTRRTVHSLVAQAFIGARPTGLLIRHLDGDKLNNTPSNLKYGTDAENVADMLRHGTYRNMPSEKTHCPKGHPYDSENTRLKVTKSGGKSRNCRACERAAYVPVALRGSSHG